jgi:hypothetical protein
VQTLRQTDACPGQVRLTSAHPASAWYVLCVLKGKSAEGARAIMRVIVLIANPVPSPSRQMLIAARVRRCVNVCYS